MILRKSLKNKRVAGPFHFWSPLKTSWRPATTTTKAKSLFLDQIQIQISNEYLVCGYCRINGWIIKNMDKGPTIPKWVLIVQPKIPQMQQYLSAQCVCPSPKVLDFNEKRLHWASVVRGSNKRKLLSFQKRVFMSWCCSCHSFVKCCFMFKYEHCAKAQSLTG